MRRWRKALVAGGLGLAVLVPSGVALAGTTPAGAATTQKTCTGNHDQLRLRDGTGPRHATMAADKSAAAHAGSGYQHKSGPQDGTGPQANPPRDGTGNQWRPGR